MGNKKKRVTVLALLVSVFTAFPVQAHNASANMRFQYIIPVSSNTEDMIRLLVKEFPYRETIQYPEARRRIVASAAMIRSADSVTDVAAQKHLAHNDYRGAVSCLMARNAAMIDASDCVVAVYAHGSDYETAKGGTADTIRTAVRRGKPCIIFDPHKLCCIISINKNGDSI